MNVMEESLQKHREWKGKIEVCSRAKVNNAKDLTLAYTPGVAQPCLEIQKDPDLSYELTRRANLVAVITDGSAVLGLGNIGGLAGMPVMEGKCALFKEFADVDAFPLCIKSNDVDEIVNTIAMISDSFGGINLEDIAAPRCFEIEAKLKEKVDIPVFHDDQHGTAIACLAAVIGALRFVKKDMKTAKFVVNGCGAAGSAIGRLLISMGAENVTMVDRFGALYEGIDANLDRIQSYLATVTNKEHKKGTLADIAKGADVLIGVSAPNVFTKEIIASMADKAIVFALANPVPETSYADAIEAGAAVAGTGRSDSPNQVNNVTVFPGVFRGAIDVRAKAITEEMKVAAVYAISELIDEKDLRADYVVPDAFDPRVAPAVAAAVARVAIETGIARIKVDPEEVRANTMKRVGR